MSNPVHQIRLREPWRTEEGTGEILLYRRFGKPSNLQPSQKVWIVFPEDAVVSRVSFNSQALDASIRRWEISSQLVERNEIEVVIGDMKDAPRVITGVVLEIVG